MAEPACLLCGSARARFWKEKAGRRVHRCPDCRCIWVPEGLVRNAQGESIYEEEEPIFLKDGNERYYLDETNLRSCREKVTWISSFLPARSRLLDVGSNFGHFLKEAGQRFDATGIEISKTAVERSRSMFDVRNFVGSVYEPPPEARGPWDAITSWDVIEHVPDPAGALERMRDLLAPGGMLFLSTPDAGAAVARAMGSRWHYLDPIQHIVLFGRKNLSTLLEKSGFRVDAVRSFGHFYRFGYVFDRLAYLNEGTVIGRAVSGARGALGVIDDRCVYVNLRDVMGIAARRV
jgi:2-polyprenyl-3-methyl-5-hydroxy-6-metoxy-1,4-benzoquinol methylase